MKVLALEQEMPDDQTDSVRPPCGTRRVFKLFARLGVGSGKVALPRITPSG
jgi:hypothetical protein